jgi:hypothetical protein
VALYAFSKVFELTDTAVYKATADVVSGHTLKHITAALATYLILWLLQHRLIKSEAFND